MSSGTRRGRGQSLVAAGVRAGKALRLGRVARRAAQLLPPRYQVQLEGRFYTLNQHAGNTMAHVDAAALEARFAEALALLAEGGRPTGDYLEFGVYVGATMTCFDRARRRAPDGARTARMFGFDSFEGMPVEAADEAGGYSRPGLFRSSLEQAQANLERAGVELDRVTLVEGWFEHTLTPQTLVEHRIEHAGVIMLDCDLYSSARSALEFCAPLIGDRAVVFLDDWAHGGEHNGEQRAWREFLAAHPALRPTALGSYPAAGREDGARVFLLTRDGDAGD